MLYSLGKMVRSPEIYSIQREQDAEERIEIEFPQGIVSAPYYSGRLIQVLKGPDVNSILVTEESPLLLSEISQEVFGTEDYDEEKRGKLLRARTVAQKKLEPVGHIIEAVREKEGSIVIGMFLKERPQVFETPLEQEDRQIHLQENMLFSEDDFVLDLKGFLVQNYTDQDLSVDNLQEMIKNTLSMYQIPRLRQNMYIRRFSSELEVWWKEIRKKRPKR